MLSAPVLLASAALSAGVLACALRRLEFERVPQAAVLAAAFFVGSLLAVPIGPGSVHLLLNGLLGLLLGWTAVPAIFTGLLLQTIFFGFGGLLALGANTLNIALPALLCAALLRRHLRPGGPSPFLVGVLAGALGVLLTGALLALTLALSSRDFGAAARLIALSYVPLALVEGVVTGFCVSFLMRVVPERLGRAEHRLA